MVIVSKQPYRNIVSQSPLTYPSVSLKKKKKATFVSNFWALHGYVLYWSKDISLHPPKNTVSPHKICLCVYSLTEIEEVSRQGILTQVIVGEVQNFKCWQRTKPSGQVVKAVHSVHKIQTFFFFTTHTKKHQQTVLTLTVLNFIHIFLFEHRK